MLKKCILAAISTFFQRLINVHSEDLIENIKKDNHIVIQIIWLRIRGQQLNKTFQEALDVT